VQDLLEGYKYTRKMLRALCTINTNKAEREVIGGMINDCNFVIEWLSTGRRPGNRRGIERRAAYQREKLMDPIRMQAFTAGSTAGSSANLSDWQRFQIENVLSRLTPRERECYVMAHGECLPHSEIAFLLNISKNSVKEYIRRAQKKISDQLQSNLFFIE